MILRSGPAIFAMEMKRAMITRNFSRGRFKVDSPDKELASVAQSVLEVMLPTMADEFTWSALVYGTSFQEQVWSNKTKYELGLSSSRSAGTTFAVPDVPNSVNPKTIAHIRRGAAFKFDGFEQRPNANQVVSISGDNIVVKPPAALVIPFQSHFRNLWGQSIFKPVYPIWLWYEITLRTLARYMERMAMPVALGKAPMRGMLQVEGQTAPVKSMDLMLAVAANVAKSNAVVIPSDYDEAGHAKYDLSYLTAQEKGSEFISVLRLLAGEMVRAVVISEQAVSPGDSVGGSYNAAAIQAQSTAISNLLIELSFVSYLNRYFMPNFSLFNRGQNGPPIRLVTENADSEDRDLIIKLMATMGNSPASQSFYEMLDMRTLGELSHIPMLSEADAKSKADEKFQQGLDHQEAQQELISKYAVNKDGTKQFGGVPPTDNKKPPVESKAKETQEKLEAVGVITKALIDGQEVPWVLGLDEVNVLHEQGVMPEEAYKLFNPYHDKRGLFSSTGGIVQVAGLGVAASGLNMKLNGAIANSIVNRRVDRATRDKVNAGKSLEKIRGEVLSSNIISTTVGGKKYGISYDNVNRVGTFYTNAGGKATSAGMKMWTAGKAVSMFEKATDFKPKPNAHGSSKKADTSQWPKAKQESFKSMYRTLAKKYHPDVGGDTATMSKINKMYSSGKFNDIEDLFNRLEVSFGKMDIVSLTLLYKLFSEFLSSNDQYLVFDADGEDEIPPFVVEDGEMIIDRDTADLFVQFVEYILSQSNEKLEVNDDASVTEEVYRLFNPFHDRRGLFAPRQGGGGGGVSKVTPSGGGVGAAASSLVSATNQAKSKPGSVIGTLGTILGIAGLGAVGLLAVAAISANASEPEINPQAAEKEVEAQKKLAELTKNWPKYQSADEAFSSVMATLKSDGIDIPDGAKLQIGNFPPEVLKKYPTAIGLYDSNTNTMYIADDLASSIKNGDPAAVDTLAHELSHANQVVSKEFPYGENPDMVGDFTQDFSPLIEGQNDLLTSVEMSKMYKQPVGPDNIPQLSNEFAHLQNRLSTSKTGVTILNSDDGDIISHGYEQEAKLWAVIATEGGKNTGSTPTQYLSNAHRNGFNAQTQHQNLVDAFPSEMESGGFIKTTGGKTERKMPTQADIRKWAAVHGYADLSKAYNQMLEEAAQ
jgi:hypothetical protein